MHRTLSLLALLCLLPAAGNATVYKVVDEHGNVTYTDLPAPGAAQAEPVKLPIINRQPATEVRPAAAPEPPAGEPAGGYRHASLSAPIHDTTLAAGESRLAVEVALEPALQEGHWVQVLIDGAAAGSPVQDTRQSLQLERGTHFLSATVLDGSGRVVAETGAVAVHVQRPIVGGPASGQTRPPGTVVPRAAPR